MRISEVIKNLEEILATEGDIRVTVYDEHIANEGRDYEIKDLWIDAEPVVVRYYHGKEFEKFVQM